MTPRRGARSSAPSPSRSDAPPVGSGPPGTRAAARPRRADRRTRPAAALAGAAAGRDPDPARLAGPGDATGSSASAAMGASSCSTSCARCAPAPTRSGSAPSSSADDPRVTRVGRVLRRFSLDEVPNLINVLRGEMAIVGPRPTIPSQVELFSRAPASASRGSSRDDRLGADQRPDRDRMGRADRARHPLRRAPFALARSADPRPHRLAGAQRSGPLHRRLGGLRREAPEAVGADRSRARRSARAARAPPRRSMPSSTATSWVATGTADQSSTSSADAGGRRRSQAGHEVGEDRVVDRERLKAGNRDRDVVGEPRDLVARAGIAASSGPVGELVVEHRERPGSALERRRCRPPATSLDLRVGDPAR